MRRITDLLATGFRSDPSPVYDTDIPAGRSYSSAPDLHSRINAEGKNQPDRNATLAAAVPFSSGGGNSCDRWMGNHQRNSSGGHCVEIRSDGFDDKLTRGYFRIPFVCFFIPAMMMTMKI